jgi:hypothetical protein
MSVTAKAENWEHGILHTHVWHVAATVSPCEIAPKGHILRKASPKI